MADVNDIYEVKYYCYCIDQVGINVCHYLVDLKSGTGATDAQIAALAAANAATDYQARLNMQAQYLGVAIRKIRPLPVGSIVTSSAGAGSGGAAGDALPRQTCGVLTVRTALGGRAGRGRLYVPFPAESNNSTNGKPDAGYVSGMVSLFNAIKQFAAGTGGNTNRLTIGVYHRGSGTIDVSNGALARDTWGTQRRRGSYGHTNPMPSL